MPTPILMPALSPTMTEGTLSKWVKGEGDTVSAGDVIAEIETDKATMEVEAVDEGKLAKILVTEGTANVAVNRPIAVLLEDGEDINSIDLDSLVAEGSTAPAEATPEQDDKKKEQPQNNQAQPSQPSGVAAQPTQVPATAPATTTSGQRVMASPLAKRLAQEKGIDLRQVTGSGPHGRIIKRDIEGFSPGAAGMMAAIGPVPPRDPSGMPQTSEIPHTMMRKAIARRLQQSKQELPHFYLTIECNLENLLTLRKSLNRKGEKLTPEGEKPAYKLSVNDFIIKAVALSLIEVPEANAAWTDESVKLYNSADVSVAVAIEGGLITPIIKDAQTKSLVTLSTEMKDLAKRAREGALQPQEYEGGTFTISNLGMFGIDHFSAIINPPQAAILAVGQGIEKPIVKDGAVVTAPMMSCTLSVDHRVIDGAVGANFMAALREYLEDPAMMLV